jgi:hypothetical protein
MEDVFHGQIIDEYTLVKSIGKGQIGKVYYAIKEEVEAVRAIKIIPKGNLRDGWQNEIIKVTKLRNRPGVVNYHNHGFKTLDGLDYIFISWDYVPSESLKEIIEGKRVTIQMVVDVVEKTLEILHACQLVGVEHADLHSGNILIQHPDLLNINPEKRDVWITDFGYLTAKSNKDILDDFLGLNRIVQQCLREIDFHELDANEKWLYSILNNDLPRILTETNPIVGDYVRKPKSILNYWKQMCSSIQNSGVGSQNIGDYLAAEHIGERFDEWKSLFVPKFLSVEKLLERNICVLTGLRGCGKTMLFRRLTALFDVHLGPSGVSGTENFVGFYLNARNIAEAFPWLPWDRETMARQQVINFFHLSWCAEIIDWLKEEAKRGTHLNFSWILNFFSQYYTDFFSTTDKNEYILNHISILINRELEKTRLKSKYEEQSWELADLDFLEKFSKALIKNCGFGTKSVYFFLDDYSTPLVNSTTQRILNPIVFRRSSVVFFKVATESAESYETVGLNGKILEEDDDYSLIDNGSEVFLRQETEVHEILSSILQPRIERHPLFKDRSLTIDKILGKTLLNNTELALVIRNEDVYKNGEKISKEYYHGSNVFHAMWTSDVRESISLFAEMVSKEREDKLRTLDENIISIEVQDKTVRDAGGRYLNLLEAATNPFNKNYIVTDEERSYGNHLVEIARTFQEIAQHNLKTKNSKNGDRNPPKQARRIEITGITGELSGKAREYYSGLIRYGVFIRDNRGKSVRGKVAQRFYLKGQLIPYFRLTFSKRDSITLSWEEFCELLENPLNFKSKYLKFFSVREDDTTSETEQLKLF